MLKRFKMSKNEKIDDKNPKDSKQNLREEYLEKYEPCYSNFFQSYVNKIVKRGCKSPYQLKDLYTLDDFMICEKAFPEFLGYYTHNKYQKSLLKILAGFRFWLYFKGVFANVMAFVLLCINPICLKYIVKWLRIGDKNDNSGFIWASILLGVLLIKSWLMIYAHATIAKAVSVMLMNLKCLVRWKIPRLSSESRNYFDSGTLSSLIMVETFRMEMTFKQGFQLIAAPLVILYITIYACLQLGWVGLLSPCVMIISLLIQSKVNGEFKVLQGQKMRLAGDRTSKISELLSGMKIIKFNAWERVLEAAIAAIRNEEKGYLFSI